MIAGKTLEEWQEYAKRDDCLQHMVPSDLRQILGAVSIPTPDSEAYKQWVESVAECVYARNMDTSDLGIVLWKDMPSIAKSAHLKNAQAAIEKMSEIICGE